MREGGETKGMPLTIPEAIQILQRRKQDLLVYGNDSGESQYIETLIGQVRAGQKDPKRAVDEAANMYDSKNDL